MQPSTWNNTNQHWLSQFLLKGFGIRKKSSQVYELDKETNAISTRKVSEAASKRHLLTERDDALLRDIENQANPAINAIRKGDLNIGEAGRQAIDNLVWAMVMNDPYGDLDGETIREAVIDEEAQKLKRATARHGCDVDEQYLKDFMNEFFNHDWLSMVTRPQMPVLSMQLALRLMGLLACQSADGEFFTIGDSSVMLVRGVLDGEPNLLNPGSQVILPISSTRLLLYEWATETNVIEDGGALGKEQVRSLNWDYYHESHSRCIYGRNRKVLERSRMMPLRWTSWQPSTKVSKSWGAVQRLQTNDPRLAEIREAVYARMRDDIAQALVQKAAANAAGAADTGDALHAAAE